mmetsp:Transcript_9074/g.21568  ORF Transcript_9074/g.21568 Transcript_9074/m.21568 type:complete len:131 (-) Transcript_9074:517-909(-)
MLTNEQDDGKSTLSSAEQPANERKPMTFSLSGRFISDKAVQYSKARFPIVSTVLGNEMCWSARQRSKRLSLICRKPCGRWIVQSDLHQANAPLSSVSIVEGILTSVNRAQLAKARIPICRSIPPLLESAN